MFLTGMALCSLCWVGVTAATSSYASSKQQDGAAAQATIAFIFIFGAVYSFNITPLQALYPVEVLSFEMRAKGMAFSNLAVNAGQCVNNLGWPVALKKITWHTYIIFCVWCSIQTVVWYFLLPETKGRTVCTASLIDISEHMLTLSSSSRNSTTSLRLISLLHSHCSRARLVSTKIRQSLQSKMHDSRLAAAGRTRRSQLQCWNQPIVYWLYLDDFGSCSSPKIDR